MTGRNVSSAVAKRARLIPEKRAWLPIVSKEHSSGMAGGVICNLPHEIILAVLVLDSDFLCIFVDIDFQGLFWNFFNCILNGFGINGDSDIAVAFI